MDNHNGCSCADAFKAHDAKPQKGCYHTTDDRPDAARRM